ncbi:helix-turn-helix protein [Herbihabitans rhizosphaerae]|uniref:Helix-turn-helix protein n=1 Tax=Herbihabitans rhizosphaerae TaxID=1872711 RepID=A0A4Q7L284_9PSEU|nr:helix-turn-helix transcriptional regulator [Herbihabitans rhizosphaerae]RZS43244.1 helix-turn-helix protein [Herbihabitans rhizosphaerae]
MGTGAGPTLLKRQLGRRLRHLREAANITRAQAAKKLIKHKSTITRIEKGDVAADVHLVKSAMDLYDVWDEKLIDLAIGAAKPGWWVRYGVRGGGFVGFESDADQTRELTLLYVTGLLQTEAYMRASFAGGQRRSAEQLEKDIGLRLHRQRRLTDLEDPLELIALIDESALRKSIGGREVMRDQLRYLAERATLSTVTMQIVPNSAGQHPGMDGPFTILRFPEDEDPDVVYVPHQRGGMHVEKPEEVQETTVTFDQVRSMALSPEDSIAFVERLAEELYSA